MGIGWVLAISDIQYQYWIGAFPFFQFYYAILLNGIKGGSYKS